MLNSRYKFLSTVLAHKKPNIHFVFPNLEHLLSKKLFQFWAVFNDFIVKRAWVVVVVVGPQAQLYRGYQQLSEMSNSKDVNQDFVAM